MAAPPKPWESPGVNRYQSSLSVPTNNMSGSGGASLPPCCTGQAAAAPASRAPPPLPDRSPQSGMLGSRLSNYGYGGSYSYGSPYSSFGGMGGGMYGSPYSSYGGGYGMGYNRYGMNGPEEYNSFARQAEENSRQAFQSVESIVNAFTSVSMMLDSTFQAVYNSFRAVLGVADNFTRLKMQLGQVFSALAIFRMLRYLYRRLLVLLRLRPAGYAEEAWTQASDAAMDQMAAEAAKDPKKSSWPILVFFGIILGAPWLIWKFINKMTDGPGSSWATGEDDHFVARADFDFKAENTNELSFRSGQTIKIAPKELQPRMKGWMLASVDGKKTGLIPANYVKVLGKKRGTRNMQMAALENGGPTLNSNLVVTAPEDVQKQEGSCCHSTSQTQPGVTSSQNTPTPGGSCCHSSNQSQPPLEGIPENESFDCVFQDNMKPTDLQESVGQDMVSNMDAKDILSENSNNLE